MLHCLWSADIDSIIATAESKDLTNSIRKVDDRAMPINLNIVWDITHNFIVTTEQGRATLLTAETTRALCDYFVKNNISFTVQFEGMLKESDEIDIKELTDFDAFWNSIKDDADYDEDVVLICDIEEDRKKKVKQITLVDEFYNTNIQKIGPGVYIWAAKSL